MPTQFLGRALMANAIFSSLSGIYFLMASSQVAAFLGFIGPPQVATLGAQLLVFAVWLFWLARRDVFPRWQVMLVIAFDALWVGGSVLLLVGPGEVGSSAMWAVAIAADIVAVFGVMQAIGLRRALRSPA